jgi:outer membrane lipoprotein
MLLRSIIAGVLVVAAGCVRPPKPLQGTFPSTTVGDAQRAPRVGERVRWGGELVQTTPVEDSTCFEVVQKPLDRQARPRPVDETTGRFRACAAGFYDPAVHAPRREVTVVGTLEEVADGKIGDYAYRYPKVRAEAVWLWPEREPPPPVVYAPWGFYGWGGYWGGGFGGRRGRRH